MKQLSEYQQAKNQLLDISKQAREDFKDDKPAIRQTINDTADQLSRSLTEHLKGLFHLFASNLHPK